MNDIIFQFNELIFTGLKFKKSDRYTDDYFKQLLEEGSHVSKAKYIDGIKDQLEELIWVDLSWAFLTKITLAFTLIVGFLSMFSSLPKTFSISMLIISIISFFLNKRFNDDANLSFEIMKETKETINFIFENK